MNKEIRICRSMREEQEIDVWLDKKDTTIGEKNSLLFSNFVKKIKIKNKLLTENYNIHGVPKNMGIQWRIRYRLFK